LAVLFTSTPSSGCWSFTTISWTCLWIVRTSSIAPWTHIVQHPYTCLYGIVGFPVDSFTANFVLCTKTKVGLATQGNHSIPGKFGLKQTRRPLIVGGVC
jgi:hypothetical protein